MNIHYCDNCGRILDQEVDPYKMKIKHYLPTSIEVEFTFCEFCGMNHIESLQKQRDFIKEKLTKRGVDHEHST